jgi:hypothetical protein
MMASNEDFQMALEATTEILMRFQEACYQQGSASPAFPTSSYLRLVSDLQDRTRKVALETTDWEKSGFNAYPGLIEEKITRLEAIQTLCEKHLGEIGPALVGR